MSTANIESDVNYNLNGRDENVQDLPTPTDQDPDVLCDDEPSTPTLVIGDASCKSILIRGMRRGEYCGKLTSTIQVYCATHQKTNPITKDRFPVVLFEDLYMVPGRYILIDKDFVVRGVLTGVKLKTIPALGGIRVEVGLNGAEGRLHYSEISQEDRDWCEEMGLRSPVLVKSAGKR